MICYYFEWIVINDLLRFSIVLPIKDHSKVFSWQNSGYSDISNIYIIQKILDFHVCGFENGVTSFLNING